MGLGIWIGKLVVGKDGVLVIEGGRLEQVGHARTEPILWHCALLVEVVESLMDSERL